MRAARAALARGRRQANALMIDTCKITFPGALVTNPDNGEVTNERRVIYEGPCKVQSKESVSSEAEAGGHTFTVVSRTIHVPATVSGIVDGSEVEILTSVFMASLVGRVYRVEGFTPDTYDTAARIPVKEITS